MKIHPISAALPTIALAVATFLLSGCEKIESQLHAVQQYALQHHPGSHQQGGHEQAPRDEGAHDEGSHHIEHTIVATSPVAKDVTLTESYVCQIHSRRHIEVRALERGYLQAVYVAEGQAVKEGDLMFKILPTLYQAKLEADKAEAQLAQVEYNNTKKLVQQNMVSDQELKLAKAKLTKAQAQVQLAQAEVDFTDIKAPFDGIINRLEERKGSLIEEGDKLTTLSDNSVMWVYFNVPESRYLEYQAALDGSGGQNGNGAHRHLQIELVLANGKKFQHPGEITTIEADFNNETGNIAFRADFSNPNGLLRHGQTGSILVHTEVQDAIVIPQRATYEILDKRYVYAVGKDGVVHQRAITVQDAMEDIYVIEEGLEENDRIVLEGIRQVRDGEKTQYEFHDPEEVLSTLKYEAQ